MWFFQHIFSHFYTKQEKIHRRQSKNFSLPRNERSIKHKRRGIFVCFSLETGDRGHFLSFLFFFDAFSISGSGTPHTRHTHAHRAHSEKRQDLDEQANARKVALSSVGGCPFFFLFFFSACLHMMHHHILAPTQHHKRSTFPLFLDTHTRIHSNTQTTKTQGNIYCAVFLPLIPIS